MALRIQLNGSDEHQLAAGERAAHESWQALQAVVVRPGAVPVGSRWQRRRFGFEGFFLLGIHGPVLRCYSSNTIFQRRFHNCWVKSKH